MFTYKPKCCLGTTAVWFQIKFIYSVSKEHKIKRIVNIIGYLVFLFLLLLQTALCLGNVCKICQQISNPCCDVLRSFTYTLYIYKASKVIARQSFRRRKCFQTTTDPFYVAVFEEFSLELQIPSRFSFLSLFAHRSATSSLSGLGS